MPYFLYILKPTSSMHLGKGREYDQTDIEYLPRSDTLVAAILSTWGMANGENEISTLASNPPFALSSALPIITSAAKDNAKDLLIFLPFPARLPWSGIKTGIEHIDRKVEKELKKVTHSTSGALSILASEGSGAIAKLRWFNGGAWLAYENEGLSIENQSSGMINKGDRVRLAIDRLTGGAAEGLLFNYSELHFHPIMRLGLLVAFEDETKRKPFERALNLLGEEGIGADRSCGLGGFIVDTFQSWDPPDSLGSGFFLTLSLYHPTREEVEKGVLDGASYSLLERGGWVTEPGAMSLRRKSVRMLGEGAVLPKIAGSLPGGNICVLEAGSGPGLSHDIWRCGKAIAIPYGFSPMQG